MKAGQDKVVGITYSMYDAETNEKLDEFEKEPQYYLHGHRNIFPPLEAKLEGLEKGDSFEAELPPEETFGEYVDDDLQKVPKSELPDRIDLEPGVGIPFKVEGQEEPLVLYVNKVQGDDVILDPNHPLAGKTVRFEGEITEVREAEAEELDHGHPHVDGQHH